MKTENRILVIVRHAHREKLDGGLADNGLSEKGREQAQAFARLIGKRFDQARLISSPKLRCLETLEPLAKKLETACELNLLLGEGSGASERARAWLRGWRKDSDPVTIACSHGDVIPELLEAAIGTPIALEKGGYCLLALEEGELRLLELHQRVGD